VFYGGQTHQKDRFLSLRRCLKFTYSNVDSKIFSGLTHGIPVSGRRKGERGEERELGKSREGVDWTDGKGDGKGEKQGR